MSGSGIGNFIYAIMIHKSMEHFNKDGCWTGVGLRDDAEVCEGNERIIKITYVI